MKKSKFSKFSKMLLFLANFETSLFAFSPALKANEARSDRLRLSAIKNCPRKINKIKNWMDGRRSNFKFSFKKLPLSGKWSGGRRALTPYYSSSWDGLPSCSTSHFSLINFFLIFIWILSKKLKKIKIFEIFENVTFFRQISKLLRCKFHVL